jgi:hypothetical protein
MGQPSSIENLPISVFLYTAFVLDYPETGGYSGS